MLLLVLTELQAAREGLLILSGAAEAAIVFPSTLFDSITPDLAARAKTQQLSLHPLAASDSFAGCTGGCADTVRCCRGPLRFHFIPV